MRLFAALLALIVFVAGLVDLPRGLRFGSVTFLGFVTVLYAAASWQLVLTYFTVPRAAVVMGWFALLLGWGFSSFIWNPPTSAGVQNLMVYSAFSGLALLSATVSYQTPDLSRYLRKILPWTARLATALYALDLSIGHIFGSRSYSLFALMILAWFLAEWRYGSRSGFWWAVATTIMIALSLSRMATCVGLIMFPLSQLQLRSIRGWLHIGLWIVVAGAVSYLLVTQVESINERFFTGDTSMRVGGVSINASGRMDFWTAVVESWWGSPWVGKGAGSSMDAVAAVSTENHPHNDYLRVLHDFGLVGLGLWLLGFCGLLWTTWRGWLEADKNQAAETHIHLAAFLALVGVVLTMLTDNVCVYIFVMSPLAVMVGTSLGSLSRNRAQVLSTKAPNLMPLEKQKKYSGPVGFTMLKREITAN